MIRRKGVCDICGKEFELHEGSFAIQMIEDRLDRCPNRWTFTVLSCVDDVPAEGFSHVCGKACLYRAMDELIGRKTEEGKFRLIVDNRETTQKIR